MVILAIYLLPVQSLFGQNLATKTVSFNDWSLFKTNQGCWSATVSKGFTKNLQERLTLYRVKQGNALDFTLGGNDIKIKKKFTLSTGGETFIFWSHPNDSSKDTFAWVKSNDLERIDRALASGMTAVINGTNRKNQKFSAKFSLQGYTKAANWMHANCGAKSLPKAIAKAKKKETKKEEPKKVQRKDDDFPSNSSEVYKVSSGSGFFISRQGHILTNYHVIKGCENIKEHRGGTSYSTTTVATDRVNDIALLKVNRVPTTILPMSEEKPYPLQDVIVAGFPFGKTVSSSIKFTKGIVSSLSGAGDNYSQLQIDAALQPGNSGGPILDMKGNVVGIAVSKLDFKAVLKDFGVVPENTNFGIKSSAVLNFVSAKNIPIEEARKNEISKSELSKNITEGTTYLSCWMTKDQIKKLKTKKVMFKEFE